MIASSAFRRRVVDVSEVSSAFHVDDKSTLQRQQVPLIVIILPDFSSLRC